MATSYIASPKRVRPDVSLSSWADKTYVQGETAGSAFHVQKFNIEREGVDSMLPFIEEARVAVDAVMTKLDETVQVYREPHWPERFDASLSAVKALNGKLDSVRTNKQRILRENQDEAIRKLRPTGEAIVVEGRALEIRNALRELGPDQARAAVYDALRRNDEETLHSILSSPYGVLARVGIDRAFITKIEETIIEQRVGSESTIAREIHHLNVLIRSLSEFAQAGQHKPLVYGSQAGR